MMHTALNIAEKNRLHTCATALRILCMDMVEQAQSGHPGAPMGMADIAAVLWTRHLNVLPNHPTWAGRDRVILSNGHASTLLYAIQHFMGNKTCSQEALKEFRQWSSITPGHPEHNLDLGIETTTGPLGQGLATAVGMALAQEMMAARIDTDLYAHHTYVFVGDGCLSEGLSQEAISFAGHHQLRHLIVLFDDNEITIDGPAALSMTDDHCARVAASGWHTLRIDGHDTDAIDAAIETAKKNDGPTFIACRTIIGKGAASKQGTAACHGSPMGKSVPEVRKSLGWDAPPFDIPDAVYTAWQAHLPRVTARYQAWEKAAAALSPDKIAAQAHYTGASDAVIQDILKDYQTTQIQEKRSPQATRVSSGEILAKIAPFMPALIGGSADLTPSNNTHAPTMTPVTAENRGGQYIHYGVREHGMAAIMNGLCLYGGLRPYGGTFLVFSDYARGAMRLSALMKQPVLYIMTHDSIGLGEDGPTHQPVEHLMGLRLIPDLDVYRPADAVEVAACWALALKTTDRPSVLALSRQAVPLLHDGTVDITDISQGGYVLRAAAHPTVCLIATGTEVSLACDVADLLTAQGIAAQVSSLPCFSVFDRQASAYKERVLGPAGALRVSIEAGTPEGWQKYVGLDGLRIGVNGFGASAPGPVLMTHYGFTPDKILKRIHQTLDTRK